MTDAQLVTVMSEIVSDWSFPEGDGEAPPDLDLLREMIDELEFRLVFRPHMKKTAPTG